MVSLLCIVFMILLINEDLDICNFVSNSSSFRARAFISISVTGLKLSENVTKQDFVP